MTNETEDVTVSTYHKQNITVDNSSALLYTVNNGGITL